MQIAGQERAYDLTNDDDGWYREPGRHESSSGNQPGCRVAYEFVHFAL